MIKKLLILIMIASCMMSTSCKKTVEEPQYTFLPKENIVNDRQYYTGVDEIRFPDTLWTTSVFEQAPQYDRLDQVAKAYFLQSVDYNNSPTYVFAFVGIPETATKNNPVPGVVLIHGGGGTAFPDWVKMWNDRGYAAIAIDTEGRIPAADASLHSGSNISFESIMNHGPGNTNYSDCEKPANQQHLYHAIAGVIVANSFLSLFEEVDSSKIGITGISWGGVIATNAVAYDDRFAFAVPVYGAVSMTGTDGIFGSIYDIYPRSSTLWDNVEMLRDCRTPILFVNWDNDPFFPADATEECANIAINGMMLLIPELNHGHWQGANIEEIFNFADDVLRSVY